ncbi:hypothetical protein [Prosthecobacter sp.]
MVCDAIIPNQPALWVDDLPFLLWEIGPRRVIEHWMDTLFRSNATLRIWLEQPDDMLYSFVCETFPLNRRAQVFSGTPSSRPEACTFLDSKGGIVIRRGPQITPYLPRQAVTRTWFAMVRQWLNDLVANGSQSPELEQQIAPGVFIGHHCSISKDTTFLPPCWVGTGSTISGATIGPNTVVGENCVIASGVRIEESYVLSNTFIPSNAQLSGVVAGVGGILTHATGARYSSQPELS